MIRGSIANNLPPTLWVHTSVLYKYEGRILKIGPHKYVSQREGWLWGLTYFVKPVIIHTDDKTSPKLFPDYEHKKFRSFAQARDELRRDMRAIEMVVDDLSLVCTGCVPFNPNLRRYS